ncbi:thiamine pyrophosphate-binding protein [Treponema sp. Marseille-Q4523]|uniref:thiamine pyrophosphate-binding protein n=1 Tax=Treponema sp. Marseille-Q4523 TaxID=2810610 RepID=UPI00196080A2|nr:thiamine pyrophosphate-binding protein [Treponema sp. Marseille-Q4523]MBM7023988.1 thiamine pyrophosphate-binding protein [Treponema sp. Marseille-Q4523]
MKQRLADYIADFFAVNNIIDIFTVTGGGAMHLNDAFGHHPQLHCTYNHHEQACAIAAEGYARYSGNIAAVCVTTGPGGTNAITGVLGGWLDSIPMFIISGQVKFSTTVKSTYIPLRQLGDQEFNIVDCVKTMTKYAEMVVSPYDIAYVLEKALYLATHGRPGPVWLDIPLNIQGAIIETDNLRHYDPASASRESPPPLSENQIYRILAKIKEARRPVVFAGEGIRISGAYMQFLQLIDNLNIPVVTAWNAHDLLWDEHPLYCGRPGTVGTRGGNFVAQYADLLLILGCRLNIRQISYNWEHFAPAAYKIMVDIDPLELLKPTLNIDMPIHADLNAVIEQLNSAVEKNTQHTRWIEWCRNINAKYPVCKKSFYETNTPINPYVFMDMLFKELVEGDVIITGNGSACVCSFQAGYIRKNQRLFTNSGCASMGYGLPAALGAAVARQNKRVICIDGDGSLQMNIQELQTVIHNRLDIKLFVLNNNGYHSIRQTQMNLFAPPLCGVSADNGISFPLMEKIAYAYGFPYVRIDAVQTASEKIKEALNTTGPVIAEIILDPAQFFAPKVSAKKLPDGTMISPPLEDMYPFLSDEEIKRNYEEAMKI